MSDFQKDQLQSDASLIDAKKVNPEKSEPMPTLAPTSSIMRPMNSYLYGTVTLDSQTFPTVYTRLIQRTLDRTATSGTLIYRQIVDWQTIRKLINNPDLWKENHVYATGSISYKIMLKGTPTWWGNIVTTFNPDPIFTTKPAARTIIDKGYSAGLHVRWLQPTFQLTKSDSMHEVIIPFYMPISALRSEVFTSEGPFKDTVPYYPFGTLDIRYFTDNYVLNTEISNPTLSVYIGAVVQYGGSHYTSGVDLEPE